MQKVTITDKVVFVVEAMIVVGYTILFFVKIQQLKSK